MVALFSLVDTIIVTNHCDFFKLGQVYKKKDTAIAISVELVDTIVVIVAHFIPSWVGRTRFNPLFDLVGCFFH